MSEACEHSDLVSRNAKWLLWGVPAALLILGGFVEPCTRVLLWTPALLLAGTACVVNAARCGRRHCYITGPLYLIGAIATVLVGLEIVSLRWSWVASWVVGGTGLAYLPEWVWGKYMSYALREQD